MSVSIIIPCFRQGRYLAEAVESCLAQTYRDIEIIVVNDGSDDNTAEVAGRFGTSIRYIEKENGGVSSARNVGIAASSGQYMKFLDADDHIHPEQLAWQVEALAGRADCISVTTLRSYKEEDPARYVDIVPDYESLLPGMLNQPDGAPHAFLFPSAMIKAVGGWRTHLPITQDWDLYCRLGKLRPALLRDTRVGGYYRLRSGSLSTFKRKILFEVASLLIEMHDEFRDGPCSEWFGSELLGAEQRTYRRMLLHGFRDAAVERELLARIGELRKRARPALSGRKFDAMCGAFGYRAAEHVYVRYIKLRQKLWSAEAA